VCMCVNRRYVCVCVCMCVSIDARRVKRVEVPVRAHMGRIRTHMGRVRTHAPSAAVSYQDTYGTF